MPEDRQSEREEQTLEIMSAERITATRRCPQCGLECPPSLANCPGDGTPLPPAETIGSLIAGRYEFLCLIGEGGMSVVYKVRSSLLGTELALKMINPLYASKNALARFYHEAKVASNLSHPNVVGVRDFGLMQNGQPYLAMDFAKGTPLSAMIKAGGPMKWERAADVFIQLCDALSHAHQQGLLHRDIKPSNVIVDDSGDRLSVRLVDFGIAKSLQADQKLTQTGEVIGSPPYMSPEQCIGGAIDARSDIYSMGCLMFEVLTGKPPFLGESTLNTIHLQLNEPPPDLTAASPYPLPPHVVASLSRCLAKAPEQRFQTIEELKSALLGQTNVSPVCARKPQVRLSLGRLGWTRLILVGLIAAGVGLSAMLTLRGYVRLPVTLKVAIEQKPPSPAQRAEVPAALSDALDWFIDQLVAQEPQRTVLKFTGRHDLSDRIILKLKPLNNIRSLDLNDTQLITDAAIPGLDSMAHLDWVGLEYTEVGDEGVARIAERHKELRSISLEGTKISDKGVESLAKCGTLKTIHLGSTNITDSGLKALGKLPLLEELQLQNCRNIDNEALKTIATFPKLAELDVSGCSKVTLAAIRKLQARQPDLHVIHDQR